MGMSLLLGTGDDLIKSVPGLFAYWNAELVVLGATTVIQRLPDQSGNLKTARDLVQVSTGPTLTKVDPNWNNKPSISSSAANIRLQSTFDTNLTQGYTIYLVHNITAYAGTMFWRTNAGNNTGAAGYTIDTGPASAHIQTQDAGNAITSAGSVTVGNYVNCSIYNSTGISAIYYNNSLTPFATSPGQGTVDAVDCSVMTIGNFTTANSYSWTMMACYQGVHDQFTRQKLMNYMGSKYGVATQ